MNTKYCATTLCTLSYLPNALVSLESIKNNTNNKSVSYFIFVTDTDNIDLSINNIQILSVSSFIHDQSTTLEYKYSKFSSEFRWSLKPLILIELTKYFNKSIYIDPDIYFINDIDIIFDSINGILLTPHFRPIYHKISSAGETMNFSLLTEGYFNAGFIGCNNNNEQSIQILNLWKRMCFDECQKDKNKGLWDDQKFLETLYCEFHDCIQKFNHRGANMAGWNMYNYNITDTDLSKRTFTINNQYKPIFFHFSPTNYAGTEFKYFLDEYNKKCIILKQKLYEIL